MASIRYRLQFDKLFSIDIIDFIIFITSITLFLIYSFLIKATIETGIVTLLIIYSSKLAMQFVYLLIIKFMMQEKIPMQHKNISFLLNALFITNLKTRDIKKLIAQNELSALLYTDLSPIR